jgi:hypothetical protein
MPIWVSLDRWPGQIHVQHQLSRWMCQGRWHSFDDLRNDVAAEIGKGTFGSWLKWGNHRETEWDPKYRNYDFCSGYHPHWARLCCHSLRKPNSVIIHGIKKITTHQLLRRIANFGATPVESSRRGTWLWSPGLSWLRHRADEEPAVNV